MKKVLSLICLLVTSFITAPAQLPASPTAATDSNVDISNSYHLPYVSDAGGYTNRVHCFYNTQKIFVYRHTFNTCRFNSGIAEAYPGQPILINLPQLLEYRYIIILGTQTGGRMALGPNEHYASSPGDIPDMGPAQAIPGKVYSSVKD